MFEEALDELTDLSLFYYQSKKYDSDDPNNKNMSNHYVYFDSEDDEITHMQGVSMNTKYIFFWNQGSAWKLCLKDKKITSLNLYISE